VIVTEELVMRRLAWRSYRRDKDRRATGEVEGFGREERLRRWFDEWRVWRRWWCLRRRIRRASIKRMCLSRGLIANDLREERKVNVRVLLVELSSRLLTLGLKMSLVGHPRRKRV
jgi:hypothetical protein